MPHAHWQKSKRYNLHKWENRPGSIDYLSIHPDYFIYPNFAERRAPVSFKTSVNAHIRISDASATRKVLEAAVCCFSARSELYNLLSDPDLR
jgi:hypothetical protein